MRNKSNLAAGVLYAALGLGIVGDELLRATPWGLNVALFIAIFIGASVALARWQQVDLKPDVNWLAAAALLFAAGFAWRDSTVLKTLDVFALAVSFSLVSLRSKAGRARTASLVEYGLGAAVSGFNAVFGAFPLIGLDIKREGERLPWLRQAGATARGFLIALPLLVVFGGLLSLADAAFAHLIHVVFDISFQDLLAHFYLAAVIAWLAGGFLRGLLLGKDPEIKDYQRPRFLSLGVVEIAIPLGLLDVLFLSFVIVQFRYFFGGAASVEASTGLTYAEYARSGFFELVAVSTLVLPILLVIDWLVSTGTVAARRAFRLLALVQVLLLFVIMVSAVQRMRLYQNEYGLTELRLYTTAFMGWLALVFLWFALTVLRGHRKRFAFGATVAGLIVIAMLHLANPDGFIIRTNTERVRQGRRFDAVYATSLSADTIPRLIEAMPLLDEKDRAAVAKGVLKQWSPGQLSGWRSWSCGRLAARRSVQDNEKLLRDLAESNE
ncbi:MAG TPA: DUF4173 domain-containing protein [Blastocatellia bacterium]|nr:DUF4173 domain-containing protein [Blastocatellia bacterium]